MVCILILLGNKFFKYANNNSISTAHLQSRFDCLRVSVAALRANPLTCCLYRVGLCWLLSVDLQGVTLYTKHSLQECMILCMRKDRRTGWATPVTQCMQLLVQYVAIGALGREAFGPRAIEIFLLSSWLFETSHHSEPWRYRISRKYLKMVHWSKINNKNTQKNKTKYLDCLRGLWAHRTRIQKKPSARHRGLEFGTATAGTWSLLGGYITSSHYGVS